MVSVEELREIYLNKLKKTGSFDAAFTKAIWIAYLKGAESMDNPIKEYTDWSELYSKYYHFTRELYKEMTMRNWKVAEKHAQQLLDISSELKRICIKNSTQSGIGFNDE